uniref:Uncharacterized protein n=1 Tax=Cacopsylla melanoneura TaxID=428564 RepID=A0A8D8W7E5_9HEMI
MLKLHESSDEDEEEGKFKPHPFGVLSITSSASVSGMSENVPKMDSPSSGGGKLPRTLSTSVLRIKPRSSFWDKFWEERSQRNCHGEDLIVTPFEQILASLRR